MSYFILMQWPEIPKYAVIGEDGPDKARIQQAVDWLLSPAAQGMGQKLFEDAYALTGEQLLISAAPTTHYDRTMHVIGLNLNNEESPEKMLAHEATHAASLPFEKLAEAKSRYNAMCEEMVNSHLPEMLVLAKEAYATGNFSTLTHALETLYETIGQEGMKDPLWAEYVHRYEKPALENENKVALLRGEPTRENYSDFTAADIQKTVGQLVQKAAKTSSPPHAGAGPATEKKSFVSALQVTTSKGRSFDL